MLLAMALSWQLIGQPTRIEMARRLMARFAERTGVGTPTESRRRYLWTDAFAVCNFLSLRDEAPEFKGLALALVDGVHTTLGRHRPDDSRMGWLSGLAEAEARRHPTRGGLRIGKPLPERSAHEALDDRLEWERDGQYYHYLTKWMHALARVSEATGDPRFLGQAVELARAAHAAFVYPSADGGLRMHWKMSVDLRRPLGPSMGQHDPLDGLLAYMELRAALPDTAPAADRTFLDDAIADLHAMSRACDVATADPLGIGCLLTWAHALLQLHAGDPADLATVVGLLRCARRGLHAFQHQSPLDLPPAHRLGFRELGLAIGLRAVAAMLAEWHPLDGAVEREVRVHLDELERHVPLADRIEQDWLVPAHRTTAAWTTHFDINEVMLATSLAPDAWLAVGPLPR